jgi:hypothetical protein
VNRDGREKERLARRNRNAANRDTLRHPTQMRLLTVLESNVISGAT